MKENFTVLQISRESLQERNWDARSLSDEEMEKIAKSVGKSVTDGGDFRLSLDCAAEQAGLGELEENIVNETLNDCEDNIDSAEEALKTLGELHFCDEKIDDGCDSGEDRYVMMRSYRLEAEKTYHIRIYYGDCTRQIGCFDVEKEA